MSENNKIIRFDLTKAPTNEIEAFRERIRDFASLLIDEKSDPQTHKTAFITALLNENDSAENYIDGFSGITYADITGTDLINLLE